ncbi:putative protein phosphatase 2C-type [bacterium BMS3Bbin12]|nr:putative protein phosphatase 2C-type [bacterium BMS3Bbin12]GBE50388.1 putative protein phosphatase 2C-type [bacterium BMS3Bbin13]HDJ86718.1 serine/threonine-protein phosphatase [Chromatiales bacterium]HDO33839.1 serine/threonine-protein phosphatase [Chromatiales bacterium]
MGYEIAQASLRGDRDRNQDRIGCAEIGSGVLLVLADGLGGHPRGELAAEVAVDTVVEAFRAAPRPLADPAAFLCAIFEEAHARIVARGLAEHPPVVPLTTCVAVVVEDGCATWAHAGDSRLYLLRAAGEVLQTRDHNVAEDLYREGSIDAAARRTHPLRHRVTRVLGGEGPVRAQPGGGVVLEPGDVLLLCSDGLSVLPEERILGALRAAGPLAPCVESLARAAVRAARPHSDNVSVLALRRGAARPPPTGVRRPHAAPA